MRAKIVDLEKEIEALRAETQLEKRYECRVIASVDEAGEYVINTQFDHNGKSSITHSVDASVGWENLTPQAWNRATWRVATN